MKRILLLAIGCMLCGMMKAQHQRLFDEYLKEVGNRAEIFVGKIEPGYPSTIFLNHPYWSGEEFLVGEVMYKGLLYRNVLLRYDVFLQQLVVKTPVKQSNVHVPMQSVESFSIGGTPYMNLDNEFVAVLYNGNRMKLVERMRITQDEDMNHAKLQYEFKRNVKYFVLHEGRVSEVKSMKSVSKLYPELQKELKRFAKMNKLDFRENRQSSLISMVKYADELLAQSLK